MTSGSAPRILWTVSGTCQVQSEAGIVDAERAVVSVVPGQFSVALTCDRRDYWYPTEKHDLLTAWRCAKMLSYTNGPIQLHGDAPILNVLVHTIRWAGSVDKAQLRVLGVALNISFDGLHQLVIESRAAWPNAHQMNHLIECMRIYAPSQAHAFALRVQRAIDDDLFATDNGTAELTTLLRQVDAMTLVPATS